MRAPLLVAAVSLVALAACSSGGRSPLPPPGGTPPAPGAPPPAPVELEKDALAGYTDLLLLPGRLVSVRYSPDSLDRAAQVQRRLEAITATLQGIVGAPVTVSGLVLDREAWAKARVAGTYGLPARHGAMVFAVAADADAASVKMIRGLTGGSLPALSGEPLRGTAEEASSLLVADSLLDLEVTAAFLDAHHVRASEPWIEPLLAELVARLVWQAADPGAVPATADLFDRMAAAAPGGVARRLADYRRELPLERSLAFESAWLRGADAIWVAEGDFACRHWLKKVLRSSEPVTRVALEKRFPSLLAWERATFEP
jgi:hypothetical protein